MSPRSLVLFPEVVIILAGQLLFQLKNERRENVNL